MTDIRILFEKTGQARYLSHLDTSRCFQRAMRRAGIPAWYTEGFHPHLYLSFPFPLALGYEGLSEPVDIRIISDIDSGKIVEQFNAALPEGFRAFSAAPPVYDPARITSAEYDIVFRYGDPSKILEEAGALLSSESLPCEKKTKKGISVVDIRPHIKLLHECTGEGYAKITLMTAAGISFNINPSMFFSMVAERTGPAGISVVRKKIICDDGSLFI